MTTTNTKKILGGIVLSLALGVAAPALAQGQGEGDSKAGPGAIHEAQESSHEQEAHTDEGIVNWWSFDYGEKTKDPSHKGYPPPFGWALVNFVVFLGVLSRILWKPLKAGWEKKHDTIKHDLDEASRLRKEAEAKLAEYTKKVSHVDDEVKALLEQLRRDAEQEALRLKAEADRQIKVEIERARAELRKETVDAALKAAEQILRSRITNDDQQRLADKYVAGVEANRVGGAS
jgi:F-type H+-transporting ATPase subunit b